MNIGEIIRDTETLEFLPDHLETKKMRKHAVNKLLFLIKDVPDQNKTQHICYKVVLKNAGKLVFISDCYKDQIMS